MLDLLASGQSEGRSGVAVEEEPGRLGQELGVGRRPARRGDVHRGILDPADEPSHSPFLPRIGSTMVDGEVRDRRAEGTSVGRGQSEGGSDDQMDKGRRPPTQCHLATPVPATHGPRPPRRRPASDRGDEVRCTQRAHRRQGGGRHGHRHGHRHGRERKGRSRAASDRVAGRRWPPKTATANRQSSQVATAEPAMSRSADQRRPRPASSTKAAIVPTDATHQMVETSQRDPLGGEARVVATACSVFELALVASQQSSTPTAAAPSRTPSVPLRRRRPSPTGEEDGPPGAPRTGRPRPSHGSRHTPRPGVNRPITISRPRIRRSGRHRRRRCHRRPPPASNRLRRWCQPCPPPAR